MCNNRFNFLVIFLLSVSIINVKAQIKSVIYSKINSEEDYELKEIFAVNDEIIAIGGYNYTDLIEEASKFNLYKFNKDLKLVQSKLITIPDSKVKEYHFNKILKGTNNLILFSTSFDKKKDSLYLYAHQLDYQGNIKSKAILIDKAYVSKKNLPNYEIISSEDYSKILIITSNGLEQDGKKSLKIIDSNLKHIWNKEIDFSEIYFNKAFGVGLDFLREPLKPIIDNDGNIVIVALYLVKKDKLKDKTLGIFSYLRKSNVIKTAKIDFLDINIESLKMQIQSSKSLIIAGFYSEGAFGSTKGLLYYNINLETSQFKNSVVKPFDQDFFNKFSPKKKIKEISSYFKIVEIQTKSDSNIIISAEYQKDPVESAMKSNFTSHPINYTIPAGTKTYGVSTPVPGSPPVNNDIIELEVSKSGDLMSFYRIAKAQESYYLQRTLGFTSLLSKGKSYFFYNDNPENMLVKDYDDIKNSHKKLEKARTMAIEVDSKGNIKKSLLLQNNDPAILLFPKYYLKINNTLIIYGQVYGGDTYLVKIVTI